MSQEATKNQSRALSRDEYKFASREKEIRDIVRKLVAAEPLAELRTNLDKPIECWSIGGIYIRWTSGWGCECSIDIKFDEEHIYRMETEECDDPKITPDPRRVEYILKTLRCETSWSSTSRSVSQSVAAVSIYQRAINLAASLESVFCEPFWLED